MSPDPQVSIIIPFLNAERFLDEAIRSVLAQTYDSWELLLVNDGSTDGGGAIASRYANHDPSKVRCVEHPRRENRGLSASRNLGIAGARGEFLAFLDADDVWLPQKLEQQVAILKAHPAVSMVYGPSQRWYSWTGLTEDQGRDYMPNLGVAPNTVHSPPMLLTLSLERKATTPCPSNVLLRRATVEDVGRFEESFRGIYTLYEDQVFFSKLTCRTPVFVSSQSWDRYRRHPDSCAAVVKKDGRAVEVRGAYLKWLAEYLVKEGIDNAELWAALHRQLWPYWHPILSRVINGARQLKSRLARAHT
jgi:glycosyltransferase involved in cell wall biosynthesis